MIRPYLCSLTGECKVRFKSKCVKYIVSFQYPVQETSWRNGREMPCNLPLLFPSLQTPECCKVEVNYAVCTGLGMQRSRQVPSSWALKETSTEQKRAYCEQLLVVGAPWHAGKWGWVAPPPCGSIYLPPSTSYKI